MEKFDVVSKPSHYAEGRKYEPKDVIRDWGLNFNLGSAVKYISRAGRKDDILQDLRKAKQFLEFEIEALSEESEHKDYDLLFPTEEDANDVLDYMKRAAYQTNLINVADLFDIIGFDTKPEDRNYGWRFLDLLDAIITPAHDGSNGYYLNLPKPVPINKDPEPCIRCKHYKRCLDHDEDPNCCGFERRK